MLLVRVAIRHRYGRYICVLLESWGKNIGKQAVLLNWALFGHISVTKVNSVFKISHICAGIVNICSLEVHRFSAIIVQFKPCVKIYAFLLG